MIVPAKGVKQHSVRNWRTFVQAAQAYEGECEILFCVEDKNDPAFRAVKEELPENRRQEAEYATQVGVKVCSRARTCSQKLHNIISGIDGLRVAGKAEGNSSSVDWDYVLFLDDDVKMHDRLLDNLVDTLEQNEEAFMCTAYPFDVPALESGLVSYCVAAYHLRLIIAFSLGYTTTFVWGGCMLYRKRDLIQDAHKLVSSWRNGGYSDDLIASSICQANKLTIMCNPSSVLLQELPKHTTFKQYWNYMSRQVFVLDTYTSGWHKVLNHMLIGIHTYLSILFILSMALNMYRYVYVFFKIVAFLVNVSTTHSEVYQYSIRHTYVTVMQWAVRYFSAISFFAFFVFAVSSLRGLFEAMDNLFTELYGESYVSNSRVQNVPHKLNRKDVPMSYSLRWSWWQHACIWVAFCIDVMLFVPAAIKALCTEEIEWSGVKYWKKDGLVSKVEHSS